MSTPHISANKTDFAKTVLMPGDPLRAKMIAERFLTDAKLVNNVRGIQGYSGYHNGKFVSVMASGMGMPSMGIYSYELFKFYDVDRIIRIGSAGAIPDDVELRDIIIAMGACSNSNFCHQYELPGTFAPVASYDLLVKAVDAAKRKGLHVRVGNILTSDTFYDDSMSLRKWEKMGVLGVEMEDAALYMNAARLGKEALAILTVSDCPLRGLELPAIDRQESFLEMIEIALAIA